MDKQEGLSPEEVKRVLMGADPGEPLDGEQGSVDEETGLTHVQTQHPPLSIFAQTNRTAERCFTCGRMPDACKDIKHEGQVEGCCGPKCAFCPDQKFLEGVRRAVLQ